MALHCPHWHARLQLTGCYVSAIHLACESFDPPFLPCIININDIASRQLPALALLLMMVSVFWPTSLALALLALNGSVLQGTLASPNADKHTTAFPQSTSPQIIKYFADHDFSSSYLLA